LAGLDIISKVYIPVFSPEISEGVGGGHGQWVGSMQKVKEIRNREKERKEIKEEKKGKGKRKEK